MIISIEKNKIKTLDTAKLISRAEESMRLYQDVELSCKAGNLTFNQMKDLHTMIYENSPYEDIWDFMFDYKRYRVGLPIYIDIKLKEVVE